MARESKRLEKIRQNPKTVRFAELRRVAEEFGAEDRKAKGSHVQLAWKDRFPITVPKPHRGKSYVNVVYVRKVLARIDEIEFEAALDQGVIEVEHRDTEP